METQEIEKTEETKDPSELKTYQEKFNYGQARINFELNAVDKDVIKALNLIVDMLKKVKELPTLKHDLREIDFSTVDKAVTDACERSQTVASIKPPGCEGPYKQPPD